MLRNRDLLRQNKANKAIQASILANIGKDSLKLLKDSSPSSPENNNQSKLLDIASTCNDKMLDLFNDSQESIGKFATKYYAMEQHTLMKNAVKNKEDIGSIPEISSYVYNDEIIEMYQELERVYQSDCKSPLFVIEYSMDHLSHHFDKIYTVH